MEGLWGSIRMFCWGVVTRIYYAAPAVLFDPFDIYNKYLKDRIPEKMRWEGLEMLPADWFPYILFGGLTWAAILTFHELRNKTETLKEQADDRIRRKRQVAVLSRLYKEGFQIDLGWIENSDHESYRSKFEEWFERSAAEIETEMGEHEETMFRTYMLSVPRGYSEQWQFDRWFFHCKVEKLRITLGDLGDRLR